MNVLAIRTGGTVTEDPRAIVDCAILAWDAVTTSRAALV
jgi:hypothetical protein